MFHQISSWPSPDSPHRFKPKSHTRRSSQIVSLASWSVMQHAHRDSLASSFSSYLYLSLSLSLSSSWSQMNWGQESEAFWSFLPTSELKALLFKTIIVLYQSMNFSRMQQTCTEARYRKSFEVKKLDYFISHCWKDERFAKVGPCRPWMVLGGLFLEKFDLDSGHF